MYHPHTLPGQLERRHGDERRGTGVAGTRRAAKPAADAGTVVVNEALLARIWQAQRFERTGLATLDGQRVQVVYPGRRRAGGGPDFQGALVVLDGTLRRGGVELHVRTGDWGRHGHDGDPAYDRCVLHVVLHDDGGAARRTDGSPVPTLALLPWLNDSLEALAVDLPSDPLPWPLSELGPCAPDAATDGARLEAAGLARFALRQAHYAAALAERPVADLLLGGLVEAMGYGANREPARQLAARLPAYATLDALAGQCGAPPVGWQALLLGLAGLLAVPRGAPIPAALAEAHARAWPALGPLLAVPPLAASTWQVAGLRPVSHPARRLVGLGTLLAHTPLTALLGEAARALLQQAPERAARALAPPLVVEAAAAGWAEPAGRPGRAAPALIGAERAADIVVNVLLPLLAAWGQSLEHAELTTAARACYQAHPPAGDNERLRHMRQQVLGRDDRRLTRTACLQQGLLHIYAQTCDARRCGECVVAPRSGRDG